IERYNSFFTYHIEFYNYYRRGAMAMDDKYFVRGNYDLTLTVASYQFVTDKEFSTCHDATVATIMAYDMLIVYLKQVITELKNTIEPPKSESMDSQSKMFWTGTKTDLIELLYALQANKSINSGTMDVKDLAEQFERCFNVDLGNYYRTFIELRSRKTGRTKFLDRLIQVLEERMDAVED